MCVEFVIFRRFQLVIANWRGRVSIRGVDLPVLALRDSLLRAVDGVGRVLLRAPTGSGKSTCVPQMLLDGGVDGRIVVVQPRRMVARMLSRHVAALRSVRHGGEVGHVVRFENNMGVDTRVVYVTDGVLQRWLHENPLLDGVGAVVFDEFHERRIASDVALARCLDLQDGGRPGLKLVVMSATLEVAGLGDYLAPCEVLETEGRSYPVETSYRGAGPPPLGGRQAPRVWERVAEAVREAVRREDAGNILVFLPGVYEIRRCIELVERAPWSRGWDVFPLYSGLSPKLQDAAVAAPRPGGRPRVIVSTNVAETSLTIEGVRTVIDSGLARVAHYDPVRGIDTLMIEKISRASADQRAGRAGRTAPGRCVRLWSEAEHGRRPDFDLPELLRVDLAEVVLMLKASGVDDLRAFRWLTRPDGQGLEQAETLLRQLGALDAAGRIKGEGRAMASFSIHPRSRAGRWRRFLSIPGMRGCCWPPSGKGAWRRRGLSLLRCRARGFWRVPREEAGVSSGSRTMARILRQSGGRFRWRLICGLPHGDARSPAFLRGERGRWGSRSGSLSGWR